MHTQYFADQLTLFQPGGTDYAHLITTGLPVFSDLPTTLHYESAVYVQISYLKLYTKFCMIYIFINFRFRTFGFF